MAKTYLEINPTSTLILLDSETSVGGTWSRDRLYPGLKTNNLYGSLDYSDFPMDTETFGVKEGEFIPGTVVHEYLTAYAKKFNVYERIRFGSWVQAIERRDGPSWTIHYDSSQQQQLGGDHPPQRINTTKLIIATGLTSEPFIPQLHGSDVFDAPIFHAKSLAQMVPSTTKAAKNVVILGGSKSAYDAAYAYASQGVTVDWVIRESGNGPVWMSPPYVTPLKRRLDQLVGVRFLTWLSPCIWGENDGFGGVRRFLHGTKVGRWLVDGFWKVLSNDVITANGFDKHPETKKLKPWISAFWIAAALGILNYPTDIYEYVRNGTIKVHLADIERLSPKTVHLSNGSSLPADALIFSTGWKHRTSIDFLPHGSDAELGLPYSGKDDALVEKADHEILTRFPRLAAQPPDNTQYKPYHGDDAKEAFNQPYRLYHFMVPPAYINDRSIAYVGMIQTIHTTLVAQAQVLWLTAYFSGRLMRDHPISGGSIMNGNGNGHLTTAASNNKPKTAAARSPSSPPAFDKEAIRWETVLHTRFGRWRYPGGYGKRYPDVAFDGIPYIDMLLRDLGVRWYRKQGWWQEWFHPYEPKDYEGLVDEWRIANASKGTGTC